MTMLEEDTHNSFENKQGSMAIVDSTIHCILQIYFKDNIPDIGKALTYYSVHGITYSISKYHHGNSFILVQQYSSSVPAQIEHIFQLQLGRTIFLVQYF